MKKPDLKPLPAIGSYVRVPFQQGTQIAHVVGHTRTGRLKVRPYKATYQTWATGTRTLDVADCAPLAGIGGIPAPPALT